MLKIRNWKEDEIQYLKDNYMTSTIKEIANYLGRTESCVTYIAGRIGLKKQIHIPWTDEEIKYLRDHYIDMTSAELSQKLNHSVASINTMRDRLGLVRYTCWSDEEIQYLKDNFETMTYEEIGKTLNRTASAVDAKCFDLGLTKKEKPWEEWETEYLLANYREMPAAEIAEKLNRTITAVRLRASRNGMKKSPYSCNYHYFDVIDTEHKAYWLGFLMADGWISYNSDSNAGTFGVEIQYRDIKHLKKLNKDLEGNYKITDRWRKCTISNSDEEHHFCVLRVYSTKMYEALVSHGFTTNKSFEACIPNISDDLKRHFLRGYFDGNGSISNRSKGNCYIKFTTASKTFVDDLFNLLADNNISIANYSTVTEYGTTVYDPYIDKEESNRLKFLHYIYDGATIYLERKYKKAMKAFEHDIDRTNDVSLAC